MPRLKRIWAAVPVGNPLDDGVLVGPLIDEAAFEEMRRVLKPGGVFALWSDDPEDTDFMATARAVFTSVEAHEVLFDNPLTGGQSSNTVYVAHGHATKR